MPFAASFSQTCSRKRLKIERSEFSFRVERAARTAFKDERFCGHKP